MHTLHTLFAYILGGKEKRGGVMGRPRHHALLTPPGSLYPPPSFVGSNVYSAFLLENLIVSNEGHMESHAVSYHFIEASKKQCNESDRSDLLM